MYKILFVCTANIYRSRFSEEVFNYFAIKNNLSTRAFSAGLMVGSYKTRKIYKPALDELDRLNIDPIRAEEFSIHVDDIDLKNYNMIICMDEKEHKPMVESNSNVKEMNIIYWNIGILFSVCQSPVRVLNSSNQYIYRVLVLYHFYPNSQIRILLLEDLIPFF